MKRSILYLFIAISLFPPLLLKGQWTAIPSGTINNLTQIIFPDALHGYILTDKPMDTTTPSLVLKTSDGGNTWSPVLSKSYPALKGIDFLNADTGVVIGFGTSDSCYITFDGGTTWTRKKLLYNVGNFFHMNSVDEWIYVRGQHWGHTSDGGITWIDSTNGNSGLLPITTADIQFISDTEVIGFGTYASAVFKSVEKGMRWPILLSSPSSSNIQSGCFATSAIGYFAGNISGSYRVFKSIDGGLSWTKVDSVNGQTASCIRYVDANNLFLVGANGYIAKSTDGATSWTQELSGTVRNLNKIILLSGKAIAIGDSGTMLMNTSIPYVSAINEAWQDGCSKVYPSPFTEHITVEAADNNTTFDLYDNTGRQILCDFSIKRGKNQIGTANYKPGSYFYRLTGKSSRQQGKLIKL